MGGLDDTRVAYFSVETSVETREVKEPEESFVFYGKRDVLWLSVSF